MKNPTGHKSSPVPSKIDILIAVQRAVCLYEDPGWEQLADSFEIRDEQLVMCFQNPDFNPDDDESEYFSEIVLGFTK
ncbi:MAG: hypothetical protein NUW00_04905 [Candidatus Kaiserbacteria bacterium]|nr:hypothetical protein [Candidatus Kaiserbacteria bacterium]MCR4330916.1 hypothetical protein [Patescibacteria group bacterium]